MCIFVKAATEEGKNVLSLIKTNGTNYKKEKKCLG
jgi:hypothetical protein